MSQLICKNLLVGYEGKAILDPLNFEIHTGDYLCVVGENGAGKSTLMKASARFAAAIPGKSRWAMACAGTRSDYLPQSDHRAEGFSSVGAGNRAVWLPEPLWTPPILQSRGKAACAGCHAQNADWIAGKMLLPGAFRRSAAARLAGARPLRYPENAASGRACFRS